MQFFTVLAVLASLLPLLVTGLEHHEDNCKCQTADGIQLDAFTQQCCYWHHGRTWGLNADQNYQFVRTDGDTVYVEKDSLTPDVLAWREADVQPNAVEYMGHPDEHSQVSQTSSLAFDNDKVFRGPCLKG
ncbi:MAG: hypothetical protein M1836_005884 [Candelina mexicana]|nr:MAG: hypothetical protein M1836_005884 [Candelina mexicana]